MLLLAAAEAPEQCFQDHLGKILHHAGIEAVVSPRVKLRVQVLPVSRHHAQVMWDAHTCAVDASLLRMQRGESYTRVTRGRACFRPHHLPTFPCRNELAGNSAWVFS
jgi:hypothetical protein